jgi:hypothetical protein
MADQLPSQELDAVELNRRLQSIPGAAQEPAPSIQEPPAWKEIAESEDYKSLNFPDKLSLAKKWGEETKAYASTLPGFNEDQAKQIDDFVAKDAVEVPADIKAAAFSAGLVKGAAGGIGALAAGAGGAMIGGPLLAVPSAIVGGIATQEAAEKGLQKLTPNVSRAREFAPGYAQAGEILPSLMTAGLGVKQLYQTGKTMFQELGAKKAAEELAKYGGAAGLVSGVAGTATRAITGAEVSPKTVAEDVLFGIAYSGLGTNARVNGYTREQALNLNERVKANTATPQEFRDWNAILAEAQAKQIKGVQEAKITEATLGGRPVVSKTELTGGVPEKITPYYEPLPAQGSRQIVPVEAEQPMRQAKPAIYEALPEVGVRGAVRGTQADTLAMQQRGIPSGIQEEFLNLDEPTPRQNVFSIESQGIGKNVVIPTPEVIIPPAQPKPMEGELVREGPIITPRTELPTTQRMALPERTAGEEATARPSVQAEPGTKIPRLVGGQDITEGGFISTDFAKLAKNYFTSSGALTNEMADTLLASKYNKGQLEYETKFRIRDFNKALKEATGSTKMSPELSKSVRDYISGTPIDEKTVPPKVLDAAKNLRSFLDQGARNIISEPGLLTEKQKATVEANIGSYLSRDYEKFDNPNFTMDKLEARDKQKFAKSVDFVKRLFLDRAKEEVQDAASNNRPPVEWLRKIDETQSVPNDRLMGEVQRIVEAGGARELGRGAKFTPESYGISKDLQGLKARKDIPEEIRYLMGEYQEPIVNFAKSALKQINLYVDQRTLNNLRDQGINSGLFYDYPAPNTVEIAPKGSEVLSPLNGLYAEPDVAEALRNFDVIYSSKIPGISTFAKLNAVIKWSKTVGSVRSQARNFIFNIPIQIQNGNFDFLPGMVGAGKGAGDIAKSTQMIMTDYGIGTDTAANRQLLRRAIGLGVVNNAKFNEMEAILKDAAVDRGTIDNFIERYFYKGLVKPSMKAVESASKIKEFLDFAYRAGDNFHKIALWRYRTRALMDGKGMSERDAEIEAADYVSNSFATYEKLGRFLKALRANPFSKNFISWNAERIRNSYHILKQAAIDLKDPGMRKYGIRTMVGNLISFGIFAASRALAAYATGWSIKKIMDLNYLAPGYQKAGTLLPVYYDSKKKEVTYIDLSYSDPFDILRQPYNAFTSEDSLDNKLIAAIGTFFGDFLGLSIATETAAGLIKNERADGTEIVNPKASPALKLAKLAQYAGRVIEPATISDMRQLYYSIKGEPDPFFGPRAPVPSSLGMLSSGAGFRVQKLNLADEVFKKARSFNNSMGQSTRLFTAELVSRGKPSRQDLSHGVEEMNRARIETYQNMRKVYNAATSWGLTQGEAAMEMRRGGMSASSIQAVITGRIPKFETSRKMAKEIMRETPEDYNRRMEMTRELLKEQE